jgi:hypothetical protein
MRLRPRPPSRSLSHKTMDLKPMANRLPVGPGSRGGHWHEPAYRSLYFKRWRLEHPEYRERERRRRLLDKAFARLARVLSTDD